MYNGDSDDEGEQRIMIPDHVILYMDIDQGKKESNGESINTHERMGTNEEKKVDENKPNLLQKILECNLQIIFRRCSIFTRLSIR